MKRKARIHTAGRLFRRERQGWYVLNPKLAVRHREEWRDIYQHAGIDLIAHMGPEGEEAYRSMIAHVLSYHGEKDLLRELACNHAW